MTTVASAAAVPSALKTAIRSPHGADEQGEADDAVAGDHHGGEDGVAGERRGVARRRTMSVTISADLDHRDRDRQHQRPEGLPDPVRDHLGVVDGGEHGPGQNEADDRRGDGDGPRPQETARTTSAATGAASVHPMWRPANVMG